MLDENETLATSDKRKHDRRYQQHRYAAKSIRIANQILPQDKSSISNRIIPQGQIFQNRHHILGKIVRGSTVKTRLPARSWRHSEWTEFHDEDLIDVEDKEFYDDVQRYKYCHEWNNTYDTLRQKISEAIKEKDADYLFMLLKQRTICQDFGNYWRRRHRKNDLCQGTILSEAISNGNHACVQTVLYAIDCTYLPRTLIDHVNLTGRTSLWYACLQGNLSLVKQLIEGYHAHVSKCGVLIVAAQNGYEEIVKFLLDHGCDPNRYAKNYNERALHAASRRNHLEIVRALLQHGADPTIRDDHGRTALDYAIHKRHIDIAKLIITYQGDRFSMTKDGFTPLMLAARCNNTSIVNIFSQILPQQQFLDELSLLACNYIIHGIVGKRDEAYCYFEKALSRMSSVENISITYEAYQFRRECQTLDELAQIRDNDDALRIHALLVCERLLMKSNDLGLLLSFIVKQSNFYKWNGLLHRSLQLRMHAYRLILQHHDSDPLLHKKHLLTMVSDLLKIVQTEGNLPIKFLEIVWTWILKRVDNIYTSTLFKLLIIATYLIGSGRLDHNEQHILLNLIRRTLRRNCTMPNKHFIFTHCILQIAKGLMNFTLGSLRTPTELMARLLINCGADVDEADPRTSSSPLHLVADIDDSADVQYAIRILLDANAHTDYVDNYGYLPGENMRSAPSVQVLQANRKLSLKCRCAYLINANKLSYVNSLPTSLINFVQRHGPRERPSYSW